MKKLKYIIPTLGLCAIALSATGAEFETLVDKVVANSPTLQADRLRMESELEALKNENTLSNPEVEFERLWRSDEGENRWSAGISQEIDWPGTYGARRKAISALARAQDAETSAAEINERVRASQTIIGIIAARKEIAILEEIHTSMQQLEAKLLTAWNHGEATILDVNKVKIETIRSASRLETARTQLRSLEGELNAMTGGDVVITIPADLDMPVTPLKSENAYLEAMESSPMLAALNLALEASECQTTLAKTSRLPGFSIGYNHAYEDGAHFNGFSIGMTLPVWSRKHNTKSAADNAMAARFDVIARRTQLASQIHTDYSNAESLYSQMGQYGPLVEGVNNLTLLRKAFDGGELNLLNYLQEVNYFLEARLDYLSLTKEYAMLATSLTALFQR